MTNRLDTGEEQPLHESRASSSRAPISGMQMPDSYPKCARQQRGKEETPGPGDQTHHVPSSSCSAETEEVVVTCIRVTDVALGLGRVPVGFYAVLRHSGHDWRTENKHSSVYDDVVEWNGPIPLPSDLSATVCLAVYASFEFQPMLGAGEQLRELTTTVEQLLDHSAKAVLFSFLPKDGDVVSPCSSIFVTAKWRKCGSTGSLASRVHCSTTESRGELEEATNRGHSALLHYQKNGVKRDLECSVTEFERALDICPLDHPGRAAALANLAMAKSIFCQVEDTDILLEVPLRLYRDALVARPVGHLDRPSTLIQLAAVHFARFEKQRDEIEGARAAAMLHEAMELGDAESHESQAAYFMLQLHAMQVDDPVQSSTGQDSASRFMDDPWLLSEQLLQQFKRFGDLASLQKSIAILKGLVRSTPAWDVRYHEVQGNLGIALRYRFTHLGKLSDLEEGISRQREAVKLTPHGLLHKLILIGNLGNTLVTRFEHLGDLSDLEDAISCHRDVVNLTVRGHPNMPPRLRNLGNVLFIRFQRLGELSDLEHAISNHKDAVALTPHGHPHRAAHLSSLGNSLSSRFDCLGELGDLEDAISALRDAVTLTPQDHPHKPIFLTSLSSSLKARFKCLGQLCDLEEAVSGDREAIELASSSHPHRLTCLNNFGNSLFIRFQRLGELTDLEDAILSQRDAVALTPQSHPDKPARLNSLGNSLSARFDRLGELADLEDAISALRDAVDLTPHGHPNKPHRLSNLGITLKVRFRHLGKLSDIEDAASSHRDAIDLVPSGHPDKPGYINNLGNTFRTRFEHLGELGDLRNAISMHTDAVGLSPRGHPRKPDLLNNLANSFLTRFERLGEFDDLENAISRYRDAVDLTPDGHPHKPICLDNLGNSFVTRFDCLGEPCDLEQAIFLYSHAASAPTGPIKVRFDASQKWIICARRIHHHSVFQSYSVAVSLLPQLAWIGLPLTDRYSQLIRGADVVREAAAVALDAGLPEIAVEWLEQGRSIVWGELFQLRDSYEELSSSHPDHAYRLRELSTALERASATREKSLTSFSENIPSAMPNTTESLQRDADRHRTLAVERDKLLQEIRSLPGFGGFLLHKEFSQLRVSAHSGPVVILNAAESRCDALIVLADVDHVVHVPLPSFPFRRSEGLHNMLEKLLGHARAIRSNDREGDRATRPGASWESLLSILWNGVVKPVLDALAFSIPGDPSRIFWCPTGPFAFLPIHAAGFYDIPHSQHGHKVSDFVISSYAPTLSILSLSSNSSMASSGDFRFLAVRQPLSDGLPPLPGVDTELKHLRTIIGNSPSARTTLLESSVGTVEEVLALMKVADWVHFACHGIQDATRPTESGLCLADRRRLKLRDIIALSRPRGGLAFLSACQTATGDERLSEEAIHIAAGMLFAGYAGVIGTMWSISDKLAPRVARDVYAQLFRAAVRPDYREAARALHDAIRRLRDDNASFDEWLPFIHVGL